MQVWRAEYESRNFSFCAYGLSHKEALDALYMGLEAHREQYDLDADWYYKADVYCEAYRLGVAYRDDSIIYESGE
jgi:hypothetical protein